MKIVVSADYHDFCPGQLFSYQFDQRQTVHKRHFNICNKEIGLYFANHRKSKLTVRSVTSILKAVLLPQNVLTYAFPYNFFILDKKNLKHAGSSLLMK